MVEAVRDFHYIGKADWKAAEESSLRVKAVRDSSHSSRALSKWRRKKEEEKEKERELRGDDDVASESGSESSNSKSITGSTTTSAMTTTKKQHDADKWRRKTTIVQVFNPESKVDARIRELNNSLRRANNFLENTQYSPESY